MDGKWLSSRDLRREHVRENVQTLHALLMALAIGNALRQVAAEHSAKLTDDITFFLTSFDWNVLTSFVIGVLFIFRFFLSERLTIRSYQPTNGFLFVLDILYFFFSSVVIAYLSFFVVHPAYFYIVFAFFLICELCWWWVRLLLRSTVLKNRDDRGNIDDADVLHIGLCQIIGAITLLALLIESFIIGAPPWLGLNEFVRGVFSDENLLFLGLVFGLNVFVDLTLNGSRYFGIKKGWLFSKPDE